MTTGPAPITPIWLCALSRKQYEAAAVGIIVPLERDQCLEWSRKPTPSIRYKAAHQDTGRPAIVRRGHFTDCSNDRVGNFLHGYGTVSSGSYSRS